jgi:S-formylglutathione hydrolase FrmB
MQALKGLAYDRKVECMASWRRAFREGKCARMRVVGRGLNLAMSEASRCALAALLLTTAVTVGRSQTGVPPAHPQHEFFHVSLSGSFANPVSGRLLVFVGQSSGDSAAVDMNMMSPESVYLSAKEVSHLAAGESIDIDADDLVFPRPLSEAAAGTYRVQAVLDVGHTYNYEGRAPGDLISSPISIDLPFSASPTLTLAQIVPQLPDPLADRPDIVSALKPLDFVSPVLTQFWGREIHMCGWVLLPPGYENHPAEKYPTVYFTHGFGGTLEGLRARYAPILYDRMKQGKMPEMIWVLLDESSPTGTHEFADSVNNGPWGKALTTELIPHIEAGYRMDARTSGRFLQGHSSGGWATLWLQTHYPKMFGGTWSTSPDPSDFHFFSTIDLYAKNANFYRDSAGALTPILRDHGQARATMQQLAGLESVLGDYGGQLGSFEWVFSPRGPDGRPQPLFNRVTGAIDPGVASYWRTHYDIVEYLGNNWNSIGSDLRGKIHLVVGTDDTFYLDGAAHSLESALNRLGGQPHFTFLPGRSHFNVYAVGEDRFALFDQIAAEMYQVARPAKRKK